MQVGVRQKAAIIKVPRSVGGIYVPNLQTKIVPPVGSNNFGIVHPIVRFSYWSMFKLHSV